MKLSPLFSDGAVFQRNENIPIWGSTDPSVVVKAEFAGKTAYALSAKDGTFRLHLPPVEAGGPYELTVSDRNGGSVRISNVLVGEVWLASGQSNMEFRMNASPVQLEAFLRENRDSDSIRMFTVHRAASSAIESGVSGKWAPADAENVGLFSAVALWFAYRLRERLGVPVGILHSSWGGTYIQAWTSREMLARNPEYRFELVEYENNLREKYDWNGFDPAKSEFYTADLLAILEKYSKKDTGNTGFARGWAAPDFDDSQWKSMRIPGNWITGGINENGATWFRKTLELPAHWAGKDLIYHSGGVDKHDITYFNGVEIGRTGKDFEDAYWSMPRTYSIPGNLVKAGKNLIAVRAYSFIYDGGFVGGEEDFYLELPDSGETVSFAGESLAFPEYSIGKISRNSGGQVFMSGPYFQNSPHILFDAMIAPLIPYAIRGVIWYQGETNAHTIPEAAAYARFMRDLIEDWRFRWGLGDFPFLMVELANYRSSKAYDPESTWAVLRDSQRKAAAALPNVAISHTTDVGDILDIHPKDKRSVGTRLARIALAGMYSCPDVVPNGPEFQNLRLEGSRIRVTFRYAEGLHAETLPVKGFFLAASDGVFRPAEGTIEGSSVVLSSPEIALPRSVRYSWADNPVGNLYNAEKLPAAPFGATL